MNLDAASGTNPTIPGVCVREKEFAPCLVSADCPIPESRCKALGRTGQRYCVAPTRHATNFLPRLDTALGSGKHIGQKHGGLGNTP